MIENAEMWGEFRVQINNELIKNQWTLWKRKCVSFNH